MPIGKEPANKLAMIRWLKLTEKVYIVIDKYQRSNIEGVYAAGDMTGGLNQWVTACAEGAIAAITTHKNTQ